MTSEISFWIRDREVTAQATVFEPTQERQAFDHVVITIDDTRLSIFAEPNGLVRLTTALLGAIDKLPVREHDCGPLCRIHGDPRDTSYWAPSFVTTDAEAVAVG